MNLFNPPQNTSNFEIMHSTFKFDKFKSLMSTSLAVAAGAAAISGLYTGFDLFGIWLISLSFISATGAFVSGNLDMYFQKEAGNFKQIKDSNEKSIKHLNNIIDSKAFSDTDYDFVANLLVDSTTTRLEFEKWRKKFLNFENTQYNKNVIASMGLNDLKINDLEKVLETVSNSADIKYDRKKLNDLVDKKWQDYLLSIDPEHVKLCKKEAEFKAKNSDQVNQYSDGIADIAQEIAQSVKQSVNPESSFKKAFTFNKNDETNHAHERCALVDFPSTLFPVTYKKIRQQYDIFFSLQNHLPPESVIKTNLYLNNMLGSLVQIERDIDNCETQTQGFEKSKALIAENLELVLTFLTKVNKDVEDSLVKELRVNKSYHMQQSM